MTSEKEVVKTEKVETKKEIKKSSKNHQEEFKISITIKLSK